MSAPFFKYAGGKRRLAPIILPLLGPDDGRPYVEPFVGGGAVFLARAPEGAALLNDRNPWVAATWRAVRDDAEGVIAGFGGYARQDSREFFYDVRRGPPPGGDVAISAWFLYVNKAGFNGLLRVNAAGGCNVPYGDGKPPVLGTEALRAASVALARTTIVDGDFEAIDMPAPAAIYCDPPYLPLSATASFTGYAAGGFSPSDQLRLARWARAQADRGSRVVISNAGNADSTTAFARVADRVISVSAARVISCKGTERQPVPEFLFVIG